MAYPQNSQVPNENIDRDTLILNGLSTTMDGDDALAFYDYLEETKKSEDMLSKEKDKSVLTTELVKIGDGKEKLLTLYFSDKHFKVSTEQLIIGDGKEKFLTLLTSYHKHLNFSTEQLNIGDGKEKFLTLLSSYHKHFNFSTEQVKIGDGKEKLLTLCFSDKHFKVSTEQLNIGDGKEKFLTVLFSYHKHFNVSTEQLFTGVRMENLYEAFTSNLDTRKEQLEYASAWLEQHLKAVPDWNNKNKRGADKNTVLAIKEYNRRFKLLKELFKDAGDDFANEGADKKTVPEIKEYKPRLNLLKENKRRLKLLKENKRRLKLLEENKRRLKLLEENKRRLKLLEENKRRLKLLKDMHGRRGALLKGADKIIVTEIKEVHKKAHMDFKGLLTDAEDDFAIEDLRKLVENVIMKNKRRLKLLKAKHDRRGVLLKGADKKTVTEIKGTMQYYHRIESREYTETTTNDKECRTQLNAYVKITLEMLNIALEIVSSQLILHRNIFPEVIRMFLHFPTMEEDGSKEQKLQ